MTAPDDRAVSPGASPAPAPRPNGGDHVVADQSAVFAFLADPATHGLVEEVTRIDTHGAAVFLAGPLAYKVKRAVFFPFMDFSTLEKRRTACAAEVEISGAGAPGLYLGVVPIVRTPQGLALGGDGPAVEYAVKMRRFDPDQTLDRIAERGGFTPELTKAVAATVVAAHAAAPVRRGFDAPGALGAYLEDNIAEFSARPDLFPAEDVERLATVSRAALARVRPLLAARSEAGFVRRCHGDMHLRNIALIDGRPVLFDAIEFNDEIATCDVLYDLAFLLMDLWQRDLTTAANAIFNRYLWAREDAELDGLKALPLFLSLRAGIRAKVEAAGLAHLKGEQRAQAERRVRDEFAHALRFADVEAPATNTVASLSGTTVWKTAGPPRPALCAVGGLSGSGKSTWAAKMASGLGLAPGAVVLRSDIERKRLSGAAETEKLPPEAYTAEASARVYDRLRALARRVLATGHSVIVDAVHARPEERDAIEAVAQAADARFYGVWLDAPEGELMRRVEARTGDASDADARVVRRQLAYDLGEIRWRRPEPGIIAEAGRP
ncbi:AAA family ATPase [Xanthobacter sp. V3C-3]|uniref:bifunctional aminoglycoside phosphotransferase/ATP-binding protein n=1 Tax=Xanthobacter lutulentifluminis TaxID=3119935 RepID=UPI003728AFAD